MNSDDFQNEGKQIYDKTWAGDFWGPNGAVRLSESRYNREKTPESMSALSSTYYAAANNTYALAKGEKGIKRFATLLKAAEFLYLRALSLSNELEKYVGLNHMTADMLDVRAAILRRAGFKKKALACLEEAFKREMSSDTRVLLLSGKAEILASRGKEKLSHEAYREAEFLVSEVKPTTRVRYLKSRARSLLLIGWKQEARLFALEAWRVARDSNLEDQAVKIRPLLRELGVSDPDSAHG